MYMYMYATFTHTPWHLHFWVSAGLVYDPCTHIHVTAGTRLLPPDKRKPKYMLVCVCVYVYVCDSRYSLLPTDERKPKCTYVCTYVWICIYVCMHVCVCVCVCMLQLALVACLQPIQMRLCVRAHVTPEQNLLPKRENIACMCAHTDERTHIHACTHTQTHGAHVIPGAISANEYARLHDSHKE
jgi:hypothetical protein